jgi:adenylate cyclase
MPEERTTRRLAAILAADVVGYSRLMAGDEAGTLSALKRHRDAVFNPSVAANNGRIVKLIGDGTLVEFASVVDAVNCAISIQRAIAGEKAEGPRITLRIGVNLGDIIIDDNDIYGDGVNVAARLEPLAEPGGICVSSIVNESVGRRVDVAFADGGEVNVKNIDRPIRVWKWHPSASTAPLAPLTAAPKPKAEAQSIAVLPFNNMSQDPEQEYFSDGITEDIITDLSKVPGLMVIARNSSFTYKGRSVDVRTVGRELGVRSVLEGSIRKAGNRVRITAQLIDAETGGHVWAERYDRDLTDIFTVQDEVTLEIVGALKVALTPSEKARIADSSTRSTDAHDTFLRAREILNAHITKPTWEKATALLEHAIALDPNYAEAYAGLAFTSGMGFSNNWGGDPKALDKAAAFAEQAVALKPDDSTVHGIMGMIAGMRGDTERSRMAVDRALTLNPNNAQALNTRGAAAIFRGEPAAGIPDLERAVRIDPAGTIYLHFLGLAHLMLGHYQTAAAHFRERILLAPETDLSRVMLASALGHLGSTEEARRIWKEMKAINPQYDLEYHVGRLPFRQKEDAQRIRDGLRKAGLPD